VKLSVTAGGRCVVLFSGSMNAAQLLSQRSAPSSQSAAKLLKDEVDWLYSEMILVTFAFSALTLLVAPWEKYLASRNYLSYLRGANDLRMVQLMSLPPRNLILC